ncbi:MAG: hypothetical protein COU29_02175 [Candidatus Magasanikbacteria bacterium CG10_big_fil_rev_8_21_14_0_10_36_32]|uniref:LysM domain-containing protein n=1 Tax=Candidatus Magasanikbacteria bacterium CG10_big_fil_rev_8_21_14_0_10_36_32 TaxID=1974646 RepID=A0A2M6W760_9BACT|nr:MAG: hypothetical protein COU29_02175 [Candidatus Magasanikbacteria bacterium CG10_big_fil_rev_8_21_14_0_10_36_32]
MKYRVLLNFLYSLVYIKRLFWWTGQRINKLFAKMFKGFWRVFAFIHYKIDYFFRRAGWSKDKIWWLKRDNLQIVLLLLLLLAALPQTKLFVRPESYVVGHESIAYNLLGQGEEYGLEELSPAPVELPQTVSPWRSGTVSNKTVLVKTDELINQELGTVVVGGLATTKPIIIPGALVAGSERRFIMEYAVAPGDSLSSIAYKFGISVETIMWENKLTAYSVIRPGDKLNIPPTTGIMHQIKKGDTLPKIAKLYNAKVEDIVKFNVLKESGTDLVVGEKIMIPNGVKVQVQYVSTPSKTSSVSRLVVPSASTQAKSASGFIWPSASRIITQYYGWLHHAIDIGGKMGTAIYAAKAGTVEVSQCGWNSGYGCYIIINHGNGVKTLYGHHSRLLVSVGDYVTTGQTIGLMGNTGKVRGPTGVHLHFEVRINGSLYNPLSYVR